MQDIKKCMTFKNAWHHINKRMTSHQICAKQISNIVNQITHYFQTGLAVCDVTGNCLAMYLSTFRSTKCRYEYFLLL